MCGLLPSTREMVRAMLPRHEKLTELSRASIQSRRFNALWQEYLAAHEAKRQAENSLQRLRDDVLMCRDEIRIANEDMHNAVCGMVDAFVGEDSDHAG